MSMQTTVSSPVIKLVGRAERVSFPECNLERIPARIDTGARISSVWASDIQEQDGVLKFVFFGPKSPFYDGQQHTCTNYEQLVVASSMGHVQKRYKVKFLVKVKNKRIRAAFTLADRSSQVYPILIGRNVLKGKFVVNVAKGKAMAQREKEHFIQLQSLLKGVKR